MIGTRSQEESTWCHSLWLILSVPGQPGNCGHLPIFSCVPNCLAIQLFFFATVMFNIITCNLSLVPVTCCSQHLSKASLSASPPLINNSVATAQCTHAPDRSPLSCNYRPILCELGPVPGRVWLGVSWEVLPFPRRLFQLEPAAWKHSAATQRPLQAPGDVKRHVPSDAASERVSRNAEGWSDYSYISPNPLVFATGAFCTAYIVACKAASSIHCIVIVGCLLKFVWDILSLHK